ncbi:MAG: recombinase family protein [Pirellulales bacterium]|nr:recombinase family protein [Pirellulales bacterium]
MRTRKETGATPSIRCAIYTRKSTEEGLEQEYNTLDAQRDAGEAYVKSQLHEGWECLPDRYDDGGFTGANMDRPALRRLLADIESGKVNCVVVYKVDRLSRSLLDFARIMETFERNRVSFVSVTQAFNTASSMGRLILNVLLSFAQFEREMISERTRDKIAAARRKGKWSGGMPVLGYNVVETKLVVDPVEAELVREIFAQYLDRRSLLAVVQELDRRCIRTKRWTTRKGTTRGGRVFDKNALYQLLTNVVYTGKVRYKKEVHDGEHEGIVDDEIFRRTQALLQHNGRSGGRNVRNKHGALLKGLLYCAACDCAMSHSHTKKGTRLYRYYVCTNAQKRGWQKCPAPSIPAGEIEQFVVDQIKAIGRDPAMVRETLETARRHAEGRTAELKAERSRLRKELNDDNSKLLNLAGARLTGSKQSEAQDRIRIAELRLTEIEDDLLVLAGQVVSEAEVVGALADFDAVWACLAPKEQVRVVGLLVERVSYDAREGSVVVGFRPAGIRALGDGLARQLEESAA